MGVLLTLFSVNDATKFGWKTASHDRNSKIGLLSFQGQKVGGCFEPRSSFLIPAYFLCQFPAILKSSGTPDPQTLGFFLWGRGHEGSPSSGGVSFLDNQLSILFRCELSTPLGTRPEYAPSSHPLTNSSTPHPPTTSFSPYVCFRIYLHLANPAHTLTFSTTLLPIITPNAALNY